MKRLYLVLIGAATSGLLLCGAASGQPILKRVETLLRDQLEGAVGPGADSGYFGLVGDDTADGSGVQVLEVYPEQPAARGGLEANDVITSLGGTPIRSMDDMLAVLKNKPVGARLKVEVLRSGQPRLLDVTLGRRPSEDPQELPPPENPQAVPPTVPPQVSRPKLGVRTVAVTPQVQAQNKLATAAGALVISVATGSAAEQAGIPLGAVVTELNETTIRTPQELSTTVQTIGQGDFTLTYVLAGQTHRAKVHLGMTTADTPLVSRTPRPPQPGFVAPAESPPAETTPAATSPAAIPPQAPPIKDASYIERLERRIEELEARIKTLEAKLPTP